MDILTKQISDQIEGKITVTVCFLDAEPEPIFLYEQNEGYFMTILFAEKGKRITSEIFQELSSQASLMKYDDFFDKYWN